MKRSDPERIKKIISIWEALTLQIDQRKITKELLLNDEFSQWAVTTPLYNIGEHVYNLSPEIKEKYASLPWAMVAGLRHRLVHDYDGINWSIIADVVFEEMQPFVNELKMIEKELCRK